MAWGLPSYRMGAEQDKRTLDRAIDGLERELPDRLCRVLHWLRDPRARPVRIPLGLLLIVCSFFWFLPVVGIENLPMGLVLIAYDVPFLRGPVGRSLLWCEQRWLALKKRLRARRRRR
jgi:hypothetical protein